jgi:predicted GNAT family acetyltransferase
MTQLTDNAARHRFEITVDGHTAFVTYRWEDEHLVLQHTQVPSSLAGHGVGSMLARSVLEEARRLGVRIVPECEFIAAFIQRHPEFADLVVD